jgi:hypothetical protein
LAHHLSREDGQLGDLVQVADIADQQVGAARSEAGLDSPVVPTAQSTNVGKAHLEEVHGRVTLGPAEVAVRRPAGRVDKMSS